jgi:hypothetical protein
MDVRNWLSRLAPSMEAITDYTDGDETDHARTEYIELVGRAAPERLPILFERQVQKEEWRYAEATLEAAVAVVDLTTPTGRGLAMTLVEHAALEALQSRSDAGDTVAAALLAEIPVGMELRLDYHQRDESSQSTDDSETSKPDPSAFRPNQLRALLDALREGPHYSSEEEVLSEWLQLCVAAGHGLDALAAIDQQFDADDPPYQLGRVLDKVFETSLLLEGRGRAYRWIVRAHVQQHGWGRFWSGAESCRSRLRRVAELYRERWRDYIRDTSQSPWRSRSLGGSLAIGLDLWVFFLLEVDERDLAREITEAMVRIHLAEMADQPLPPAFWSD